MFPVSTECNSIVSKKQTASCHFPKTKKLKQKLKHDLTPNPVNSGPPLKDPTVIEIQSGHLAEGLAGLLLFCHALGHPLLVATQLVVPFDLQKLHLLFAPVPFPLQPHELKCRKKNAQLNVFNLALSS